MTERFATSGADETEAMLCDLYGRVTASFRSPANAVEVQRDAAGPVSFDRVRLPCRAGFDVDPLGVVPIARVRRGRLHATTGHTTVAAGAGDLVVLADPDLPYSGGVQDLDEDVTTLRPEVLTAVADGEGDVAVRLVGRHPVSGEAAAHFTRVRAHALDLVRGLPDGLGGRATDLVTGSLARLVAAAALATFPNTAVTAPTPTDRHDAHPATLRRAIAFIEANPDLDVSVVDVARASYVTVRAVQLAFRRHLGTTPGEYLRRVRLDRARSDLLAAAPGDDTVLHVATRWGFASPSYFAARYREAYGESPSATLQR